MNESKAEENASLKDEDYVKSELTTDTKVKVTLEVEERDTFIFDVYENPPIPLTVGFAIQQGLLPITNCISTSLLVADIVCARTDEAFKARLLSTTLFMSGLCTFLQNTVGIRLPLYQGPAVTYITPLIALMALPAWRCPGEDTPIINGTDSQMDVVSTLTKVQQLEGSLMIAGALHTLVGMFGIVGLLLRFIGPVTVVPALTLMALYIFSAAVRFAKAQWGIAALTMTVALLLSFYLGKKHTPIPWYNRQAGVHIKWTNIHSMFSILIATVVGWFVSWVITVAGGFDMSPESTDFYARTDSRTYIIEETGWFLFPYPGQFGHPRYETGSFVSFLIATLGSVIDSIGDYYACVNVIEAPPPPKSAVNRGIAIEGFMSFLSGWAGAGHATSTYGSNIGAMGITRVSSLRVFQLLGILFMLLGVVGKVAACFITIPYSVIGGLQVVNFGVLTGVMLSNLQFINIKSKRNLSIIGISMLVAMMLQYWIKTTKDAINTGLDDVDNTITMLLSNPVFVAGFIACFFDNTMPGSREERGLVAWQEEMKAGEDEDLTKEVTLVDMKRRKKLEKTIYVIPYIQKILRKFRLLGYVPICPRYSGEQDDLT